MTELGQHVSKICAQTARLLCTDSLVLSDSQYANFVELIGRPFQSVIMQLDEFSYLTHKKVGHSTLVQMEEFLKLMSDKQVPYSLTNTFFMIHRREIEKEFKESELKQLMMKRMERVEEIKILYLTNEEYKRNKMLIP